MLVQEEGRAARNQIAFHVDLAAPMSGTVSLTHLFCALFHFIYIGLPLHCLIIIFF